MFNHPCCIVKGDYIVVPEECKSQSGPVFVIVFGIVFLFVIFFLFVFFEIGKCGVMVTRGSMLILLVL